MDSRILHYEFVTGESVNITVSAEIAEVIYDSRRIEHARNERSRYHRAFSLDSEDYEGTNLVSEKTPDDLMTELENRKHLLDCLAHLPSIVQAEQIFTVDKSRVLKFLGHLTPGEMSRVDDAVRTSLALNPMGSIQRLPPIIRSTAAYAPRWPLGFLHQQGHEGCSTRSFKRQKPMTLYAVTQFDLLKRCGHPAPQNAKKPSPQRKSRT